MFSTKASQLEFLRFPLGKVTSKSETRAMAKELGATDTINSGTEDAIARVMELTNQRGVDCAIEAVGIEPTWDICQNISGNLCLPQIEASSSMGTLRTRGALA